MKTNVLLWRNGWLDRGLASAALFLIAFLHENVALPAADADPGAKAGEAQTHSEARKPAVRVLILKGTYADYPSAPEMDPMSLLLGGLERPGSFFGLCEKIDELAGNDQIQHILFDLSSPTLRLNLAQLSELSRHIHKLRGAHKRTFAWLENAGTIHYAIASGCDTIFMTDLGSLDLPSLSLMTLHFRDAMDLLGARASFVRTGDFKGAVEPFTLSEMSQQLRAHYAEMIGAMNGALVDQICEGRKLNREQFRKIQSDRLFTPAAAREAKLVDEVVPFGTSRESVAKLIGQAVTWVEPQKTKPKQLSFFELIGKIMAGAQEKRANKPAVAVLHLDGQILDGEREMPEMLVSGPTVKAIEELASDDTVQAVVARINSPGGSATASEAIRAALEKLARKKPTVISMGSLAASGGYWISCVGRPVYAEPETLTGSIGVFALKLSFGPFLKKIGLKLESVKLDESAGAMGIDRVWTSAEQERMQRLVEDIYDKFLKLVADSRKLKVEQVSPIAGGRVWSGAQAQKLGLVDKLGGLDDALAAVAHEAALEPGYQVIHRPQKKNFFELFDLFGESTDEIRSSLDPTAKKWLRAAGFDLSVPLNLVRESISGRPPKVWLLAPTGMVIR
ncbi:MAG: signal peptide peptidase SppA [Verrucomicrobia bacterium]|nr:MAG: signal peptide peptidase SppA [Verrucomicrobiota bacterium]